MELFCVAVAVAVVGEGEGEWLCDDCGWGGDFGGVVMVKLLSKKVSYSRS